MKKIILTIIFISILLTGLIYLVLDKITEREAREQLEQENKIQHEEVKRLKKETVELKETLKKEKEIPELPPEKFADVFGDLTEVVRELPEVEDVDETIDCDSVNRRIVNFFSYLDRREYIKEYELKEGTYAHFKNITARLTEYVPVVGEKNSPVDILKNTYHFYRAIKKKNIALIKEITEKEKDVVEQTMDYFYTQQFRCESTEKILPPFDVLYEYAHFFLNSMGGKAYLFRLESRMRILLFYYSTMIVHEANLREINKYGIDIRLHIKRLEDDLESYSKFYHQDKYLNDIEMVKKKYIIPSPVAS